MHLLLLCWPSGRPLSGRPRREHLTKAAAPFGELHLAREGLVGGLLLRRRRERCCWRPRRCHRRRHRIIVARRHTTTGDVILVAAGEDIAEAALPSSGLPPLLTAIAAHRAPHLGCVLGGWLCVIRVPPLIEHLAEAALPARVLIILTMPYGAPITLRLDLHSRQACARRAKHII